MVIYDVRTPNERLRFSMTAELYKFGTSALIIVFQVLQETALFSVTMVQHQDQQALHSQGR